jgi:hypothetical protein
MLVGLQNTRIVVKCLLRAQGIWKVAASVIKGLVDIYATSLLTRFFEGRAQLAMHTSSNRQIKLHLSHDS